MGREDGAVLALHYDQVGSLRVVADAYGNVIKEVLYDPFGGIIADTNPGLRVPIGFAGGLHDRDLWFVRFGWRNYDTFTGRWTAPAPIGDRGGDPDWYGYCLDDPVNGVDPLGLASKKYAGADSEAGLFFKIGGLQYANDKEELDVLDQDGQTRKRSKTTSGKPGVKDHTLKNKGPIPPGEYGLLPKDITKNKWHQPLFGDWGDYKVPLKATGQTELHERSDFFLHGGKVPGTQGCVDMGSGDRELFPLLEKQKGEIRFKAK
nr:RHS repeat-associated core domain-containing protein [Pseudodesulfovibrio sp. S3-i]